jgi:hypothetical protein
MYADIFYSPIIHPSSFIAHHLSLITHQKMSIFIEIIGFIGTLLCISAYILNVRGKLASDAKYYLLANGMGGIFLVINSVWHWALPSAIENGIWAGVALLGFFGRRKKQSS